VAVSQDNPEYAMLGPSNRLDAGGITGIVTIVCTLDEFLFVYN
jgi:hypothetical protein